MPMLTFEGHIFKDGDYWLAEIPGLYLMTQGRTKKEAYKMAKSVVIDASGNSKLRLIMAKTSNGKFFILSDNLNTLIPLLLKKQRQKANLTVAQAAKRLGSNSPNAYGVYEYGKAKPTLVKLKELLTAV